MKVMELRHLRTLAAVARHGSFTKAAGELYLTQSAVSQHVRRLEDELGVEVFRRSSRSVDVTAEGRLVLAYAQRVLREVEGLHLELEELTGLLRGELRIGGMYPTGVYDLAEVLADFRGEHPGVSIHMLEGTQDELLALLRADELDCVFTAVDPDRIGEEFAATLIWQDEFVVAMPLEHRLASGDHVTLDQLAEEDLITYRENSALRGRLERKLSERELEPRNAFVCTEMGAVRALASKGMGVAVMPRSVAEENGPAIVWRPFGPEPLTWPVALVWRAARTQPPAAKAFLAMAMARAAEYSGELDAAPKLHRVA
jgi:DNA-binding transcriptional LysR family regulator